MSSSVAIILGQWCVLLWEGKGKAWMDCRQPCQNHYVWNLRGDFSCYDDHHWMVSLSWSKSSFKPPSSQLVTEPTKPSSGHILSTTLVHLPFFPFWFDELQVLTEDMISPRRTFIASWRTMMRLCLHYIPEGNRQLNFNINYFCQFRMLFCWKKLSRNYHMWAYSFFRSLKTVA